MIFYDWIWAVANLWKMENTNNICLHRPWWTRNKACIRARTEIIKKSNQPTGATVGRKMHHSIAHPEKAMKTRLSTTVSWWFPTPPVRRRQGDFGSSWDGKTKVRIAWDARPGWRKHADECDCAGLITPGSNFMMRWDAIGMVALFWTALITPYVYTQLHASP